LIRQGKNREMKLNQIRQKQENHQKSLRNMKFENSHTSSKISK